MTYGLVKIDDPSIIDLSRKYADGTYEDLLFSGSPSPQTDDIFFALDVVDIRNEEVLTCIPDIPGGYMPTHNVLVDAMVRTAAGFTFVEVNPIFPENQGGIPETTEFSDFYLENPYCEKATNKISGGGLFSEKMLLLLRSKMEETLFLC